jgi:hypothetical protein
VLARHPTGFSILVQVNLTFHLIFFNGPNVIVDQLSPFYFEQAAKMNVFALDYSTQGSFGKLASIGPAELAVGLFKEGRIVAIATNKLNGDIPASGNLNRLLCHSGTGKNQPEQID